MNRTKISWTDMSWNPVSGCTNGCPYCYARKLANGRLKSRYLQNKHYVAPGTDPNDPFSPRFWPMRIGDPMDIKAPKKIFVSDMGDLFGPKVPKIWQQLVLDVVALCEQHTFQFLTKCPDRLPEIFPDNAWVGTTVTCEEDMWRIRELYGRVAAPIRFVSLEPLLGPIKSLEVLELMDWIIVGAQTRPEKQPEMEWVCDILDAVGKTPIFMKNNLKVPVFIKNKKNVEPYIRQEYPVVMEESS